VGAVADRAAQRGVDPGRIVSGGSYILPEEAFTPEGPAIDFGLLRNEIEQEAGLRDLLWGGFAGDKPHFGIYGKLGDNKGSFALLAAMHRLKLDGLHLGLVALAHGRPAVEQRFRERAHELGLTDRILQIPFIPHWRVPEFLRGCLAVCCLEQDFPIGFHSPIIPLEVLLCGRCLVASTEVIRKLPQWDRLPHGYGCVAVNDVNDAEELSGKLAAIVRKPELAAVVGARGRIFARDCQQGLDFPARLERVLEAAARRIAPYAASSLAMSDETEPESGGFPLTRIAAAAIVSIAQEPRQTRDRDSHDLAYARHVLAEIESAVVGGKTELQSLALAVEVEIAIARARIEAEALDGTPADPLFRIDAGEWAMDEKALGHLRPVRDSRVRILRFDYDITPFLKVETLSDFPASVEAGPSYIAVFGNGTPKEPLLIDRFTARILELSDGTRTASEIVGQLDREFGRTESIDHLAWIENLLLSGLIGVRSSKACVFHQAV
jgi:hypothetical protein